jgi:hypothetical protein
LGIYPELSVRLGFAKPGDTLPGFVLAPLLEQVKPLKAFQYISLSTQGGRRAQTAML